MEVSSQALKYRPGEERGVCRRRVPEHRHGPHFAHRAPGLSRTTSPPSCRIFAQAAAACVNLDCDHAERVLEAAQEGLPPASSPSPRRTRRRHHLWMPRCARPGRRHPVPGDAPAGTAGSSGLTMPGLFNVENALAALAVCEGRGRAGAGGACAGLMKARVPGPDGGLLPTPTTRSRADRGLRPQPRCASRRSFRSVRAEYPGRRIVTVFGCPG